MAKKSGRKGKFLDWLTEDGLLRVQGWARDGLTDVQICQNMGISVSSMCDWKNRFPQFLEAIKKGREPVDVQVENALLKSALGHTVTLKKPIKVKMEKQLAGKGKIVEERIEYAEEQIYIPPQAASQIFWLKNRKPEKWRDRPQAGANEEVTVNDGFIEALNATAKKDWEDG